MKKTLIASVLGIAGTVATSYGQGIIQFNNYVSSSYQPVVYQGANANSPTIEVALYYALGTYADVASFMASATVVSTTFIDPALNAAGSYGQGGPGGYYGASTAATLLGWNPGSTATFLVQGWQSAGGLTYDNASIKGQTGLWTEVVDPGYGTVLTGYGIVPSTSVAGAFAGGPPVLTLTAVPEPTTLALAGLGGLAALVTFRRKQV